MIHIITDSAADFEPWELEKHGIVCIPLTVMFDDDTYQENVNLTKDQFYELLLSRENFPKTSQASPQILMDLFEQAKEQGDEAIYFTLSSALSGTYQTACMIRDDVGYDGSFVVDSRNATGGQRMIVEYALRLRGEGKSAAEIVTAVEQMQDRIELYACLNTLENLYKGGRISQTVYTIGSLAQIKPIISVDIEGRVTVPAKAMGMRKGMDYLCKRLSVRKPDNSHPLYVMYTNKRSVAETLAGRIRALGFDVPDERIIQVGAAIGTHVGPEACGLVYVGE